MTADPACRRLVPGWHGSDPAAAGGIAAHGPADECHGRAGLLPRGAFLLARLLLTDELGLRIGRWRLASSAETAESSMVMLTTGRLGLLAFTLGLTISIAESRDDARRDLVVTEANAIGTA